MFLSCIWLTCFVHRLGRSSFVPADSKFKRWSMSNSFCQIHTVWCFVFAWHCGKDCDYAWAFPRAAHGIQPTFDGKHVLVVGKVLSLKHQGSIDCPGGCTSKPCCYSICISKFSRSTRLSEACLKHTEANPFKCSQRLCHFLCIPILPSAFDVSTLQSSLSFGPLRANFCSARPVTSPFLGCGARN